MEVELTKDLWKMGTKDGILNSLYTRYQLTTCTEGTVNISDVPSINVSLRECAGKASLFAGQGYKRSKTSCRNNFCSCRKCYATLSAIIACHAKTNDIHSGIHQEVFLIFFCFCFHTSWCNEKYILVVFFKGKIFSLQQKSYLSFFPV